MKMRVDLLIVLAVVVLTLLWLDRQTREPDIPLERLSVQGLMGGESTDFRQVLEPIPLSFPAAHGKHAEYQNEWWYFTGNFDTADGGRLGFQFTLFRFGTRPNEILDSAWATDTTWMAHLALSDARHTRFFQSERFARGALGLAGATDQRWWLRDWEVTRDGQTWHLDADAGEFALQLSLTPERPIILQGDAGYSRKGPEPGNASRYYSITRLATAGQVRIGDEVLEVSGLSWLDREWGSNQLSETQVGWDWWAMHLDDGRDLMLARLRNADGSTLEWSYGQLVFPDGSHRYLPRGSFELKETRWWTDRKGARWPVDWEIKVPAAALHIHTRAVFDDQHWWQGSVDYWEGMIDVIDAGSGRKIGRGYLELSGYGGG